MPQANMYLSCGDAARLIGTTYNNLALMRTRCVGPDYIKSGDGRVHYRLKDIQEWMAKENRFYPDGKFGPDVWAEEYPKEVPTEGDKAQSA
jgi:hypothetical protein